MTLRKSGVASTLSQSSSLSKKYFSQIFVSNENRTAWSREGFCLMLNQNGIRYVRRTKKPSMILQIDRLLVEECSVCCELIINDQLPMQLKECEHFFHPNCISQWLTTNKTCPNCRKELNTEDESTSSAPNRSQQKFINLFQSPKMAKFRRFVIRQPILQNGQGGLRFSYEFWLPRRGKMKTKHIHAQSLKVVDQEGLNMLLAARDTLSSTDLYDIENHENVPCTVTEQQIASDDDSCASSCMCLGLRHTFQHMNN
ncbi:hypothetical protein niasHT_023096 [Heterodera trifolii]|uniref:RING-type domain-containing protein n=1 Tax=Heterodera trifolii TaxID=157864 RepID=A0ABD2KFC3_9BILA